MTVKDAVAKRFEQLCDQRRIRPNELATRAGVTPSTVYSMISAYLENTLSKGFVAGVSPLLRYLP